MSTPIYPDIFVPLVGEDGNAFAIIGRAQAAMRRHGIGGIRREQFRHEATSGDYDNLLATVVKWFNVDDSDENVYEED